jgi:methylmalonyl-CoA mutase
VSKPTDLSGVDFDAPETGEATVPGRDAWAERAGNGALEERLWQTPEGIDVPPLYSASDLDGVDHLDTVPGLPPYLRGPYSTMYVRRPWTVRQYAGFSTAEDSNAFYRRNLAAGRRACPSPSIWPPTAATTRTTRA